MRPSVPSQDVSIATDDGRVGLQHVAARRPARCRRDRARDGARLDDDGDPVPATSLERRVTDGHASIGAEHEPPTVDTERGDRRAAAVEQRDGRLRLVGPRREQVGREHGATDARELDVDGAPRPRHERLLAQRDLARQRRHDVVLPVPRPAARRIAATDPHEIERRRPLDVARRVQRHRLAGAERPRLAVPDDRLVPVVALQPHQPMLPRFSCSWPHPSGSRAALEPHSRTEPRYEPLLVDLARRVGELAPADAEQNIGRRGAVRLYGPEQLGQREVSRHLARRSISSRSRSSNVRRPGRGVAVRPGPLDLGRERLDDERVHAGALHTRDHLGLGCELLSETKCALS